MASFIQTGLKIPRLSSVTFLPYSPIPTPAPPTGLSTPITAFVSPRAPEGKAGKLRALNSGPLQETLKRNAIQTDEGAKTTLVTNQNQMLS